MTTINEAIEFAVAEWNKEVAAYYAEHYPQLVEKGLAASLTVKKGRKFWKVIREDAGQRSVHCFIDDQGRIFKAEGWSKPAKGVRGSIFHPKSGWGSAVNVYGANYAYR